MSAVDEMQPQSTAGVTHATPSSAANANNNNKRKHSAADAAATAAADEQLEIKLDDTMRDELKTINNAETEQSSQKKQKRVHPSSDNNAAAANSSSSAASTPSSSSAGYLSHTNNSRMHRRNIYRAHPPDFIELAKKYEWFKEFVIVRNTDSAAARANDASTSGDNAATNSSYGVIHWTDARALLSLTRVLLLDNFNLNWTQPLHHLCPPLPQRLNYLHWIGDELLGVKDEEMRTNVCRDMIGIDIGTGSSCIFPLLGNATYGWRFVATEVDQESVEVAKENVGRNDFGEMIKVVQVEKKEMIMKDVVPVRPPFESAATSATSAASLTSSSPTPLTSYAFLMCNPPFFSSLSSTGLNSWRATAATASELVCEGGEEQFVKQMIDESRKYDIRWCTTMLGRKSSVSTLLSYLRSPSISALVTDTTEFHQGTQVRYGLAWTWSREEREKRVERMRQDRNGGSGSAASTTNSSSTAASPQIPLSISTSSVVTPRQKLSFKCRLSGASDLASLLTRLQSSVNLVSEALQFTTAELTEVRGMCQWKLSCFQVAASASASSSASSPTAASLIFSCDLLLLHSSSTDATFELQWKKYLVTKASNGVTTETSKLAFTRFALGLQEVMK